MAEGALPGLSGTQLATDEGRAAVQRTLVALAAAVDAALAGSARPALGRVVAGVTGFGDEHRPALHAALAAALGDRIGPPAAGRPAAGAADNVLAMPDIELACRAAFPAGDGIVLMAGTGSIAACLGPDGRLQRAGGRGHLIDDAGSGHWIASRALRLVWRAEDAAPGSGQASPLGRRLAAAIGGADWPAVRAWVYGASRGDIGQLALAVAQAAGIDGDTQALALLQQAGRTLAQPVLALAARVHGAAGAPAGAWAPGSASMPRSASASASVSASASASASACAPASAQALAAGPAPAPAPAAVAAASARKCAPATPQPWHVATAGRVFDLHPAILAALRDALPTGTLLQRITEPAHHSAARLAAGAPPP